MALESGVHFSLYRPWPTSWLSRPGKFGRGKYCCPVSGSRGQYRHRNGIALSELLIQSDSLPVHLRLLASVCICLNIACAGLSSFDLLFSKMWERLDSQLPIKAFSPL